jgi:Conserved in the green lineage and diatoms 27|uniref:Uncharacterized protein n=1 Tax=Thorea hispida TaxID=202687 RepID=A0A1C9CA98_9FLOR|nr:hypothetical protein Thor_019 [Thorea hispida]AOM65311.1 hypothetical protein Thor_019 [Thorea hispida]ARX95871.1 hypothetical protein [Thorea hispida]UNJ79156.1 hypothetical protein [Thorea hispida]
MLILNSICPVPFDQQPLNEYNSLKQQTLFYWSSMTTDKLAIFICCITVIINCCSLLITFKYSDTFNPHWLLYFYNCIFTTLAIELIFIRIYLGWSYLLKRLLSASIIYEETGWYDSQIWIKSASSLIQDRLVGIYEVIPVLIKIKKSIIIVSIIFCLEVLYLIVVK